MNKKLLIFALIFAIQLPVFAGSYIDKQLKEAKKNNKYKTTQTQVQSHNITPLLNNNTSLEIKDPKLIKLSDIEPVDENKYKLKVQQDDQIYKNKIYSYLSKKDVASVNVNPAPIDFYNVYRIAERVIRANNLEYINWRLAIRKSSDLNAYSSDANYIMINTGIYDTFHDNPDAIAFIIGHEISHILLGHSQRKAEIAYKIDRAYQSSRMSYYSNTLNIGKFASTVQAKRFMYESREMEFMADALGAELMTKAGYDMGKAMEVLNTFDNLPEVDKYFAKINSSHPYAKERIKNINESRVLFPVKEWQNEGKYNILNSNVLGCKKSSDRVSIVIDKDTTVKNIFCLEPISVKLQRIAYMSYKNGNVAGAIKYFKKLNEIAPSYENYVYLSYANEYLYKITNDEKYLLQSKKDAEQAKLLDKSTQNVDL